VVIFDKHLMEYDNKVIIYDVFSKEESLRTYEENELAFINLILKRI
jgi:hypothetical protein